MSDPTRSRTSRDPRGAGGHGLQGGLPIIALSSQSKWEEWLDENGATSKGLWLKIAKKGSGIDSVSYPEAV